MDGAVARLTDHTKYTGSHKQRFDESGKGRGKAGREDVVKDTGYVQGFKDMKITAHWNVDNERQENKKMR